MKTRLLIGCILVCWQGWLADSVLAQGTEPLQLNAERERIERERSNAEATFLKAEQACYARFAVSDCLRQARMQRRTAISELRRQELIINGLDRQSKAMSELSRIQNNVSAQQKDAMERQQPPVLNKP